MRLPRSRFPYWMAAGGALLLALVAWSFGAGRFGLGALEVARALWAGVTGEASGLAPNAEAVVLQVRAPRVAAAMAVGAALSVAGAAFQTLMRNPLVSPDILGVTAGCALGAGVAVLAGMPAAGVQALAFAGGLAAVTLALWIAAWVGGRDPILTLILTGVVVGSLFAAGIALVKLVADPYNQLPAVTFWLLGSFAGARPADLAAAALPMGLGLAVLVAVRGRMDALALTEDEARSLGVEVAQLRLAVVVAGTLLTAAAVSMAGAIGWVGLVVPHAARLVAGPAFPRVLALSLVAGAGFMLAVDTLCRTLFPAEVPPGVATAFVGTPVFVLLLALAMRRAP